MQRGINRSQNFVLQTEDGAQNRRQLSELVTRAAERHFDIALGQCNWEAVAKELGLSLIECLGLFNTSTSMIQPHSLIETYGGWSKRDMEKLMLFIAANYADSSTVDWKPVGAYMNVDALECQRVSQGTFSEPINGVGYRRICEFRDAGLDWKDIHQHFQQYENATLLKIKYYGLEVELSGGTVDELTVEWTDAERIVMKDLIEQHLGSTTRLELVDIIQRELPARPSSDISIFTSQYINELKEGRLRPNQVTQLRELVDKYGEDWDHIGETLGVLPSSAKRNWLEHGGDRVRYVRADSHLSCHDKIFDAESPDDRGSIVTSEVQRQRELSGVVDWSQVSQATGLDLRECFELSQHDIGKTTWNYGLDPFSQSLANRMTSFIEQYYPAPATVNYRAASNYMWVALDDCIRIHGMFQGKFKWTEAKYEQAAALRAQGLTLKEVARKMSRTLSDEVVRNALRQYLSPKQVPEPITVDELQDMSRIVDEYAGKYPVAEIMDKIRTHFNLVNRHHHHSTITKCIAAHLHYQAKLRDIDYADLANRIATGKTTVTLAAKELDVPRHYLGSRLRSYSGKQFSSEWTEEETRKLLDYVKACDGKPNMIYFSQLLGSKSPQQCSGKASGLKRKAFQLLLPHVVKLIVDHVAGSSRLRYDDVTTDSDEYKLLEMPLLWVCHNFRAFGHYGLEPGHDTDDTLKIRLIFPPDITANITAFAQRVKQMVSAISKINVGFHKEAERLLERRNVQVLDLTRQIFRVAEKHTAITRSNALLLMCLDLESIRDLVHIDCRIRARLPDLILLINRNASALQYLEISGSSEDLAGLVGDPDSDGYLEYPCLHTLKMSSHGSIEKLQLPVFKDVVPFPRLLHLAMSFPYPFGDDMLFRGNTGTLEYLNLYLTPGIVSIIKKYSVFTPTSHRYLKYVKIRLPPHYIPKAFATVAEYTRFVLSIAPGASVRIIPNLDKHHEDLTTALSILKGHGYIQILVLPGVRLLLCEAITMVKSLPLLSDLTTHIPQLGELPHSVSLTMLPDYVRTTFAPTGKRFRFWHISPVWLTEVNYVEVATFMLLLALACPNFDYAAIDTVHRERFMKAMQEKIDGPGFSQDAPRLRQLLFNGWNDC
ncbi:hypothetical protein H4S04_004497 [Coemansia sp. S16]|nr:hypothetical protein H4S04_004497 [Coemansia sp. S16]